MTPFSDAYAERRFGRLRIPVEMVRRSLDDAQRIYAHIVPLRVEMLCLEDVLEIDAISPAFDPVAPGYMHPDYTFEIDGEAVRFTRGGVVRIRHGSAGD